MRRDASRVLRKLSIGCLLLLCLSASVETYGHPSGGRRVIIVPRYSYYYPYRAWDWGWGGPFWDYSPQYYENTGKIKIRNFQKSDEVFVNGAYAGTADKMKTMKVSPGNYTIQIRRGETELLDKSIYVVVGKTVEINLDGR
jgi:hypothetical protein